MVKIIDLEGAKEALPITHHDFKGEGWFCHNDMSNVHLEVDMEAMALELARSIFGLYALDAKAIPLLLWIDYMNFAKHLADNPNKWARLVRK